MQKTKILFLLASGLLLISNTLLSQNFAKAKTQPPKLENNLLEFLQKNRVETPKNSTYIPLFDSNKVWHSMHAEEFGGYYPMELSIGYDYTMNVNDTIYYGIKIENTGYYTYYREDTIQRKVYSRPGETSTEYLLYDFTLQEGDSAIINYYGWYYTVDSVRAIQMFDVTRKVWYLSTSNDDFFKPIWVEGIGSLANLVTPDVPPTLYWDLQGYLTCVYHNNKLVFQAELGETYGCNFELLDQYPPQLLDCWFEPDTVRYSDSVYFYVKAVDNLSGVAGGFFQLNSPNGSYDNIEGFDKVSDSVYVAKIRGLNQNPYWNEVGIWKNSAVLLGDSAGNSELYITGYATFYVSEIVNIAEHASFEFTVYPNPANETTIIEIDNKNRISDIEITDLLGKKVIGLQTHQTQLSVSLSDLPKGIYLVKITINNNTLTKKIMKL